MIWLEVRIKGGLEQKIGTGSRATKQSGGSGTRGGGFLLMSKIPPKLVAQNGEERNEAGTGCRYTCEDLYSQFEWMNGIEKNEHENLYWKNV